MISEVIKAHFFSLEKVSNLIKTIYKFFLAHSLSTDFYKNFVEYSYYDNLDLRSNEQLLSWIRSNKKYKIQKNILP